MDPFDRDPTHGEVTALSALVRRITAPNPSPMTYTGTQTYLVGARDVVVIDPGPEDAAHRGAIIAALGPDQRIAAILATHTHVDHSPGAAGLAAATGAPTFGFGPHGAGMSEAMRALAAASPDLGGGEGADRAFRPERELADGDRFDGDGFALVALHTPGHLSNHLCFALEAEAAVFTGDHVMGWATTMISPPEGDMAAFMASLERLAGRDDRIFYPGHGPPVTAPKDEIARQLAHRRRRAEQIIAMLAEAGPMTPAALTAAIYQDVDPRLHGAAARNVFATLLGLVAEGEAEAAGATTPDAAFSLTI